MYSRAWNKVPPRINVAPGKFGKKNKRSPIYTLNVYYLNRLYEIPNKGPFTNYVYKREGVGGQKNRLIVNFYTIENLNGGRRWSKKAKACKRSL